MKTSLIVAVVIMALFGLAVLVGKCIGYNRSDEPSSNDEGGQSVEY